MIRIEKDGVYKAKRVRWGENDHGKWELVVVASDKGKQEITIFPENVPCGVKEDCMFTVDEISAVEVKVQKSGHFDYDENLDEFYDYEGYALQRMNNEDGIFTDRGYIAYKGYISLEEVMDGGQGDSMEMGGM